MILERVLVRLSSQVSLQLEKQTKRLVAERASQADMEGFEKEKADIHKGYQEQLKVLQEHVLSQGKLGRREERLFVCSPLAKGEIVSKKDQQLDVVKSNRVK